MQSKGEWLVLRGATTLPEIASFLEAIDEACKRKQVSAEARYAVRLGVEEVCLNILRHGYGGAPGPIEIALAIDSDKIVLTITDQAPHFDPEQLPPPDLSADWANRGIGGYGWHLVRSMFDQIEHKSLDGGGNRLTLTKKLTR